MPISPPALFLTPQALASPQAFQAALDAVMRWSDDDLMVRREELAGELGGLSEALKTHNASLAAGVRNGIARIFNAEEGEGVRRVIRPIWASLEEIGDPVLAQVRLRLFPEVAALAPVTGALGVTGEGEGNLRPDPRRTGRS